MDPYEKHRDIAEKYCLKSVTISMEPSGKYYASLLYENLTVKTKQKNLIMKTQRYWELIMQCMEWLCFLKIYRRKMKDTSEKVRSGWQGNKESYPIA